MAADQFVDGDGHISDDSDFYGDKGVRQKMEKNASRPLKRCFEPPIHPSAFKKIKSVEPREKPAVPVSSPPEPKCEPPSQQDVLSFLKSRPQLQSLDKTHKKSLDRPKQEGARTVAGERTPDFVSVDRATDREDEWRSNETIDALLRRVPVADPATARVGPWLWVHSAKVPYKQAKANRDPANMTPFSMGGEAFDLLEACSVQRAAIERQTPGKEEGTITRKMGPYRDQLEIDLLKLAVESSVTYGKWMFFPSKQDLPDYWRTIAIATSEGKLGPTSKVGTYDDDEPSTLICVYTYDFSDTDDVRRVLNELNDLGLVARNGRPIHYKCDAYTYLGITSSNPYKLKASLYSSKELLQNEVKALKDGSVARLKKRNRKMDEFYDLVEGDDIS